HDFILCWTPIDYLTVLPLCHAPLGHHTDLPKKIFIFPVFVFPASSATATVHLPVSNHQPLTQLTVCLSYYTLLSRPMLRNNITPPDPLIYWRSLRYTIKNEVYVEDFLTL
uniref:Pentraxin (PTX) domain-containing protein n=1 Tax=Naja naja TaxID=35670 RepID=A0A8C6X9E9_NAJNA